MNQGMSGKSLNKNSPHYKWIVLIVGSIFFFTFTAAWIFLPIIADINKVTGFAIDLDLDKIQVSWIYSAPLLAFVIFTFLGGIIADRIGIRNATIISGVLITGFGMLRGLADSYFFLVITSFLFGVGGGLLFPNLGKVVSAWFGDEKKGTASGVYLMAGGLGQVFSLSITATILLPLFQLNWRLCFLFYGILSLLTTILWAFIIKEKEPTARGESFSLVSLKIILTNKYVLGLCVIIFFAFSVLLGLTNYMEHLMGSKGVVDPIIGYLAAILSLGATVGNITLPSISDMIGKRKIFLIGSSIVAISLLILLQFINKGWVLGILIFFIGVMVGTLIPLCLTICIELKSVPEELAGTVSGIVLSVGFLGTFTVSLIFGVLWAAFGIFLFSLICLIYLICFGVVALSLSFIQQK
ncbi:MAG: MFS transporter [Candidatus Helarchaeota archaeon]|nr:MFS transporter [Candidatus Helarchaeota archaeon]